MAEYGKGKSVCSTEHTQLYVLPYLIKQLKEIDQVKGLYNDIIQYICIAITHLMMNILPYLARLSMVFQNVNIDFSKVKSMVDSTCESLNDLSVKVFL